jgi:YhgE/Pip-like protein
MSHQQPRHAAPDPTPNDESARRLRAGQETTRATRTVRFWTVPIVASLAVLSALAALYLGGILKPQTNLRHLPIAVVNEDAGPAGQQIANGLASGLDKNKFDVRMLSRELAHHQLDTARVYGAVVIPPNFSSKVRDFAQSVLSPGRAQQPAITVLTNPRAGTLGSSIASQALTAALEAVNDKAGQRLSAQVAQQTGGAPLPGAVSMVLASPLHIETAVHNPLPDGTGNGLSAFYYSLLLLLAGFTGSIVVSMLVDSMLGYVPAEFGPVYRFAEQVDISRFRTLLIKWALMVLLAVLTSAVYMAIGKGLGMPIQHEWALWLYGVFAIVAVGITSTSLIAALGSIGLLASMLLFVILGLPSAGATVPLEATPSFFGWLAKFEPMHHVFLGTRALLYLGGRADAGLSKALTMTTVGLLIGLLLGAIATRGYDRRGFHRIPGAVVQASADVPVTEESPSS